MIAPVEAYKLVRIRRDGSLGSLFVDRPDADPEGSRASTRLARDTDCRHAALESAREAHRARAAARQRAGVPASRGARRRLVRGG